MSKSTCPTGGAAVDTRSLGVHHALECCRDAGLEQLCRGSQGWEGSVGKAGLPGRAGLREVQLVLWSETHEQMWVRKELGVPVTGGSSPAKKQLERSLEGRARREEYTQS